jgi:Divergent InlB B-repeat domain
MTRRWGAIGVVALLSCWLVPVASATADGPAFGTPVDLSALSQDAAHPHVAFDPSGNALAVWQRSNGTDVLIQDSLRSSGGAFAAPLDVSATGGSAQDPRVAVDGSGNALAVWERSNGTNFIVQSSFRPAGGVFAAPVDLSATGKDAGNPEVAFDGSGNAVAVWARFDGSNNIVQSAFRPAGGAFAAPVDISATGQSALLPKVKFDSSGNALAIWSRLNGTNEIVQSSFRPAGGSFATPVDLSATGQDAFDPQVAFDASGNALAVWRRFNGSNDIVQSAFRPAGGVFGAGVDVSATGGSASSPQVAFDPSGNALAVWHRFSGGHFIVQDSFRPAGGVFAAPLDLSATGQDASEPQVAFDPSGDALAVWDRSDGSNNIVQRAFRPAGGAFEAPLDLSAALRDAIEPQVAFDAFGNAIAVWQRFNGTNVIVQAAFGSSPTPTLSVAKAGSGSGTVTSQPAGISCGATCSAAYAPGTDVTLTASPAGGSVFGGWSGDCSGSASCTVSMTQARAVTATFTAQASQLGTVPPGPGAPAPGPAVAVGCAANRLILTDVFPRSGKVLLLGVAPAGTAGKRVAVFSTWNGKQVATPTVQADLTFSVALPLPPRRLRFTNSARYVAKLGSQRSLALKFARRMHATVVTAAGRRVSFSGTITPPLAKPIQPVVIRASASCSAIGRGAIVATVKPSRRGAFTAHFDLGAGQSIVYLRAQTKVRNNKRTFSTYTLIRGVKLAG